MSYKTRRNLLATVAGMAPLIAGCSSLGQNEPLNQVEIDNNSGQNVEVYVQVVDDDDKTLFENTFSVAEGNQDEGAEPFRGDPATVSVSVNDAETMSAEWPERRTELEAGQRPEIVGGGCGEYGETPTGIFVEVVTSTRVFLRPTCETPRTSV